MASKHTAESWSLAVDQHGRPCWHNGKDKARYDAPCPCHWGGGPPPQPTSGTVVIVGDKVKISKWSEYCDEATGKKYYHNPAKPTETTWDKPKDFDKQKNAGKPPPPSTKPKPKKKGKYHSDRKGLL